MSLPEEQDWVDTVNTPERRILDLREIGMKHALTLGRFHYTRAIAPVREQCHPRYLVLVFVLSGEQSFLIDDKEICVQGGEMTRILPGQRYRTGNFYEQRGRMAWLILQCMPVPRGPALGMKADSVAEVFSLLANPDAPNILSLPSITEECLDTAFSWWDRRGETVGREMIRNRIGSLVMGAAAQLATSPGNPSDQANENRIRRVLLWMDDNPTSDISSDELAALAGICPASFYVQFKRVTGSSPKDYWMRLRVQLAAKRLNECPDLKVTEVANELGFSSSQYFATVFRRYLGVSPGAHRGSQDRTGKK